MAAQTEVQTAGGTRIGISSTLPATQDEPGFFALTFTEIGELVDGGAAGKTFDAVTHSALDRREVITLKGAFNQGQRVLSIGTDITDAGQILLDALREIDDPYAFRIVYQNGDITYFTALSMGGDDTIGTINTVVSRSDTLQICNDVIKVESLGVATASINNAGSYTGDGTFEATQASTSGVGFGAVFTVTITASVVASVDSVDVGGEGYLAGDTITLAIVGPTETTAAILDVDTVS